MIAPFVSASCTAAVPPGFGHDWMTCSVASTTPGLLGSVNTIQPVAQSVLLHDSMSADAQIDTGVLLRKASLRATANALTRLLVLATVRLLAENCRKLGIATPRSIPTTVSDTMSSVSVNPCWVFLMGAQSEGLLRAPARPSDQWLPPADQRSCVVNWITLAASLNEGPQ